MRLRQRFRAIGRTASPTVCRADYSGGGDPIERRAAPGQPMPRSGAEGRSLASLWPIAPAPGAEALLRARLHDRPQCGRPIVPGWAIEHGRPSWHPWHLKGERVAARTRRASRSLPPAIAERLGWANSRAVDARRCRLRRTRNVSSPAGTKAAAFVHEPNVTTKRVVNICVSCRNTSWHCCGCAQVFLKRGLMRATSSFDLSVQCIRVLFALANRAGRDAVFQPLSAGQMI